MFELDQFQKEAIRWVEQEQSVLVSAPTGAGKTLIAEAAIDRALSRNEEVIYTAPIKALSNQKYRDFKNRYGEDQVGIVTGDVSINPSAPIVIMTTEIYRNSLFENSKNLEKIGWIIFDEIHYLDDQERGTVWEEAVLFTPEHIRILALSATIPNVDQLAEWIRSIHHRQINVVIHDQRPVPLHFLFQCQGQILPNIKSLKSAGYLNRENWRLSPRERKRGYRALHAKANRLEPLLQHLKQKDLLPVIYFAFGRRRTEYLAWEAVRFNFLSNSEREQIVKLYDSLLERFDMKDEPSAHELRNLVEQGIAYHHAGMLPTLKEVVEQLFTSRLIKVIFTTETFALGINMPARSVIFDELEKFYGTRFNYLTTRDFFQMAGRAGRRGMDKEGYVFVRIHPNDIPYPEIPRIIYGRPEPIRSQFNTTYATLLSLYRQLGWSGLLQIYPKTFHFYQSHKKRREDAAWLIEQKLRLLTELGCISGEKLTPKGEFASSLFGYELLLSEMHEEGALENLDDIRLSILLSALVFEPRKGDQPIRLKQSHEEIKRTAEHYYRMIHKKEFKFRVHPSSKPPQFHQAKAIEEWIRGADFEDVLRVSTSDEGELVRHFRMVIQLLRELIHAAHASDRVKQMARTAHEKINRGVVDAEKQLRA